MNKKLFLILAMIAGVFLFRSRSESALYYTGALTVYIWLHGVQ